MERAAGRVEFRIEYSHVFWKGEEAGTNYKAGCIEVDEGGAIRKEANIRVIGWRQRKGVSWVENIFDWERGETRWSRAPNVVAY